MTSVLVVDDEELIRMNLVAYLEDEEIETVSTTSAENALDILRNQAFDVGIIDMRLPGMNGNELIVAANELCPDMRFIIHTGSTEYCLPPGLIELGVHEGHVFHKPVSDMGTLVDLVREFSAASEKGDS